MASYVLIHNGVDWFEDFLVVELDDEVLGLVEGVPVILFAGAALVLVSVVWGLLIFFVSLLKYVFIISMFIIVSLVLHSLLKHLLQVICSFIILSRHRKALLRRLRTVLLSQHIFLLLLRFFLAQNLFNHVLKVIILNIIHLIINFLVFFLLSLLHFLHPLLVLSRYHYFKVI